MRAGAEQRDAVTDALHPLEQMRRQQNRYALGLEAADDAEEFGGGVRIEPRRRFVEDRDLRALHQNFGKPEPLPHAARKGADAFVGEIGKPDPVERFGDPLLALGEPKADQPRGVAQIVGRGEIVVEADGIGQIADAPLDRERLARRIEAEHADLALRYVGQPEQHQDGGRLAGAVRAEQTEDFPAPDGERYVVDGDASTHSSW